MSERKLHKHDCLRCLQTFECYVPKCLLKHRHCKDCFSAREDYLGSTRADNPRITELETENAALRAEVKKWRDLAGKKAI